MKKHNITFYPLGNADTTLIELGSGKTILWDYANMRDPEDKSDKRIDLLSALNEKVGDYYDVVCFTHADNDHINGFSNYFYLDHAKKYQSEGRKVIRELWVPAAILLDTTLEDEAKILKAEARHRLKEKKNILVFSKPKKMKDWCDQQEDISYDEVKHLFVDAGTLVPGFSKSSNGAEFFVHSPFASEQKEINRNDGAIIVQVMFDDKCSSKLILGSDGTHELWNDIVEVTKHFKNEDRLEWDLFHISHHSSYKSVGPEKGKDKTTPTEQIKWLFETQGHKRCRMVSPSKPIPRKGTDSDKDPQPPHRQAANYYKEVANEKHGMFIVTMEHPNEISPKPIDFEINQDECMKKVPFATGAATFPYKRKTEKAGIDD